MFVCPHLNLVVHIFLHCLFQLAVHNLTSALKERLPISEIAQLRTVQFLEKAVGLECKS